MPVASMRVLIVDDHPVVRAGIRQILLEAGVAAVADAADANAALVLSRDREWDVIVLDLGLPGRGGLDLLRELKADRPKRPVLVLSMQAEEEYAVRALRAGASGYLTKEAAGDLLLAALTKVVKGEHYISAAVVEQLAGSVGSDAAVEPHLALSDREYDVMRRIALGQTTGDIARHLNLSVKTISTYRARVLEKLGLRNNAEVMRYAVQRKLVDG